MDRFVYDAGHFRAQLESSPHRAGEVSFLRSIAKPGMRAVDAGANMGLTAIALAQRVGEAGHIHAFEPVPEYYACLNGNLSRSGLANVSSHMLALSDRAGTIRFYKHGEGSGITPVTNADIIRVEATTLATFLSHQRPATIDLLNLDCEGSELLVLEGAAPVLRQQSPVILCELHHSYLKDLGQSAHDVVAFLTKMGYGVEPIHVERLGEGVNLEGCSHICASAEPCQDQAPLLKRQARQ